MYIIIYGTRCVVSAIYTGQCKVIFALYMYLDNTLVTRLTDGHVSKQYKPIDYDKLQALTQIKRAAGNRALQKMDKITEARKISKEQNLLQQHKSCWFKEQIRLNSMMKKLQNEVGGLRPGSPLDYTSLKEFFQDLELFEGILSEEAKEFKKCTVDPIWALREDLQYWLGENRERLLMGKYRTKTLDQFLPTIIPQAAIQVLVL